MAASTGEKPTRVTSVCKRPVHRQHAAGQRAVGKKRRRLVHGNGLIAQHGAVPTGKPAPAVASVMAMIRVGCFAEHGGPNECRVDMHAVADQFGGDFFGLKNRRRQGLASDGRAAACD